MKNENGASGVIIVLIILLLLSCCCMSVCGGLGLISYLNDRSIDMHFSDYVENDTHDEDTTQKTTTKKDESDDNTNGTPIGSQKYYNQGWDFSVILPEGWEKYTVTEYEGSAAGYYMASFEFKLPSNIGEEVSFFTITIYTPEQWAEVLYGEDEIITKNGYVYAWSHLNGYPPTDLEDRLDDLEGIKNSFEVGLYP